MKRVTTREEWLFRNYPGLMWQPISALNSMKNNAVKPSRQALLRIAVAAEVDIGTVRRYLANPDGVRELSRIRIERAITNIGVELPK
jgi:hypothetical protein